MGGEAVAFLLAVDRRRRAWRSRHCGSSCFSPFGYALRATRDSSLRSEAIGIDGKRIQWTAFVIAGTVAGIAGALFAYLKGSVFPDSLGISLSVDALVMVLLGGVETVSGAVVGAVVYKALNIWLVSQTDLSKLVLGGIIVLIVVAFPEGHRRDAGDRPLSPPAGPAEGACAVADRDCRMSTAPTLLSVEGLSKSYGGVHAVRSVSFALQAGEILALIGPNGAGKSTCFDMLNGQNIPDTGRISLLGQDVTGQRPRAIWRLGVGRTFQITATFPTMTVRENIQVALVSYRRQLFNLWSLDAAIRTSRRPAGCSNSSAWAAMPNGPAANSPTAISSGWNLPIALANQPRLLLMDEPTAGMAPRERIELMRLTAQIAREQSIGVLFTEHDMDVVFEHADRILVLNRGSLIAEGSPEEVRRNPQVRAIYLGEGLVYDARHREGAPA